MIFLQPLAMANDLLLRVVEENNNGIKDIKTPIFSFKEKSIWNKYEVNCKAWSIGESWGGFRCAIGDGIEISTRYDCKKNSEFKKGASFRINKKNKYNVVFTLWCES